MQINSESDMLKLGHQVAEKLTFPAVLELIGDVGAGKTTFTRGLAEGLGITEPVTSPSFTISKRYTFPLDRKRCKNYNTTSGELVHYDFYRLSDPGIMSDELSETLSEPNTIVVVEWGGEVEDLLPKNHLRFEITLNPDGSREFAQTAGANLL